MQIPTPEMNVSVGWQICYLWIMGLGFIKTSSFNLFAMSFNSMPPQLVQQITTLTAHKAPAEASFTELFIPQPKIL